jgi:hypothetical protein
MYYDKIQLEEQIDLLKEAQDKMYEVVELVKMAIDTSEVEGMATAYLIPSLEQDISSDNSWIGGQNPANLQSLIDHLTELLNEEGDFS